VLLWSEKHGGIKAAHVLEGNERGEKTNKCWEGKEGKRKKSWLEAVVERSRSPQSKAGSP